MNLVGKRFATPFITTIIAAALSACDGGGGMVTGVAVQVVPPDALTSAGAAMQFTAFVTGTATTAVTWRVAEVDGGQIDPTGRYLAPASAGTFHVEATSVADGVTTGRSTVSVSMAGSCLNAPLRGTGATYHYCDCQAGASAGCVPGCDPALDAGCTANGSAAAPFRRLANAVARFNGMAAGETVALCRGGAWADSSSYNLRNANCTAANTCDLRDFVPSWGSESSPRPILDVSTATQTFHFVNAGAAIGGYRVWNLDIRATLNNYASPFVIEPLVRNVDICGNRVFQSNGPVYLKSHVGDTGISIRGNEFVNSRGQGILGAAPGLVVDSNRFENCAIGDGGTGGSMFQHSIYLNNDADTSAPFSGVRVTNNEIVTDARCGGVMFVVHDQIDDLVIENNRVFTTSTNVNCFGLSLSGSAAAWTKFNRAVIRRNRITTGAGAAFDVSACWDCLVTDNIAVGGALAVGTYGNTSNTASTERAIIQNNTVYVGSLVLGNRSTTGGHVIENNAVWTNGASALSVGSATVRNSSNALRVSGGVAATTWWENPAAGDFTPVAGGPLIGAADQANFSPVAVGSRAWSPSDRGRSRLAPENTAAIDIGARQH